MTCVSDELFSLYRESKERNLNYTVGLHSEGFTFMSCSKWLLPGVCPFVPAAIHNNIRQIQEFAAVIALSS